MGETVKRHFLQPFLLPLTDQRCRLGILTLLRHVFDKNWFVITSCPAYSRIHSAGRPSLPARPAS